MPQTCHDNGNVRNIMPESHIIHTQKHVIEKKEEKKKTDGKGALFAKLEREKI